jgi:hypothetical protein
VQFRRGLTGEFVQQWDSFREELEMVQLSARRDVVKWALEKKRFLHNQVVVQGSGCWKKAVLTQPSRCIGKPVFGV